MGVQWEATSVCARFLRHHSGFDARFCSHLLSSHEDPCVCCADRFGTNTFAQIENYKSCPYTFPRTWQKRAGRPRFGSYREVISQRRTHDGICSFYALSPLACVILCRCYIFLARGTTTPEIVHHILVHFPILTTDRDEFAVASLEFQGHDPLHCVSWKALREHQRDWKQYGQGRRILIRELSDR